MENKLNFIIKDSPVGGKGIFAGKNFKVGERICTMKGKANDFRVYEQRFLKGDKTFSNYPLQIGVRTYIELEHPYFLINHSCNPNAAIRGLRTLTAIKAIKTGEEIFYDYSATEWTPADYPPYYVNEWPMECKCEQDNCRKMIACFPYLPKAVQNKYLKRGIIQKYIVKLSSLEKPRPCKVCEDKLRKS